MIIKMLGLVFAITIAQFILDLPHYKIGFYDVNINIVLIGMFWYGGWYFSEIK